MLGQNAITPLIIRHATTGAKAEDRFSTPVAVCLSEALKLLVSFCLVVLEQGGSLTETAKLLNTECVQRPKESLKLLIPATLYVVQNGTMQLAMAHLPAAIFQVMYQGKSLVVALMSVVLLNKKIDPSSVACNNCHGVRNRYSSS